MTKNIDKTKLQPGDLVRLELVGKTSDGIVFETTDEDIAKRNDIWMDTTIYGPKLVIVGRGAMIAGLEEQVRNMKVGENKNIKVGFDRGFGPKHPDLLRVISQKEFEKHSIKAIVGLVVTLDGIPARVKSVSSGRVMLDFNHPLAGEDLYYEIKILEVINDPHKKAYALADQFGAKIKIEEDKEDKKIIVENNIESSKAKGFESALYSANGNWAKLSFSN